MSITTTLKLYTGTTPNTDGVHVYPTAHDSKTAFENYVAYLSTNLLESVTIDNYRINALTIKVALSQTLNLTNYKDVTYAIHDLDNTCYYVKSAVVQSAYVIYDVEVDYWGTYIASATFDNINVLRCNRKVGVGLYDQIRATNTIEMVDIPTPSGDYPTGYPDFYKLNKIYIVFVLTYNVEQSISGSVSASAVYCLNAQAIFTKYKNNVDAHSGTQQYENAIDVITGIVGGIYGVVSTNFWGGTTTNDAKVSKAYIINTDLIQAETNVGIQLKSKSFYGDYTDISPIEIYRIAKTKQITIDVDPNYDYYVGTVNKGLKLVRTTNSTETITYKCVIHQDGLQVIATQGGNQMDITSEFEVVLTYNDGDVTNLAGIKQALGLAVKGATAVGSVGILGVSSLAPDIINMMGQHYHGDQSGNGDGVATFRKTGSNENDRCAKYPFGYTRCKSINDEQTNAQRKGAFFDAYVNSLDAIFAYPLIIGSAVATYIQANVAISSLPETAQSVIKQRLGQGIILIKV